MKKILIVHTRYQNLGGEDVAVENEVEFLAKHFTVDTLYFSNEIESILKLLKIFIFNSNDSAIRSLKEKIDVFNPDLVYVHNTWFKGSNGILKFLIDKNIKFVLKIHNFRYFCTKNLLFKKHIGSQKFCSACGIYSKKGYLFNKYFQDSILKSILVLRYGLKYFKIIKNGNFNIFVLTQFHKKFLEKLGINKERIIVFKNHISIKTSSNNIQSKKNIVYAGRVSKEKGVPELINAFNGLFLDKYELNIIGDGPLIEELREMHASKNVIFHGQLSNKATMKKIQDSLCVVTTTKLYEGQPTLLCEASSLGIPSIYPNTEGIAEFFPDSSQLSFKQYDYVDLQKKLKLIIDEELMKSEGEKNRVFISETLNEKKLLENFNKVFKREQDG
jgi:glycosyltransferase involved in cell wall biosynthesis